MIPGLELLTMLAKHFPQPCPMCKEMLGIEVVHPPEVWAKIEERPR